MQSCSALTYTCKRTMQAYKGRIICIYMPNRCALSWGKSNEERETKNLSNQPIVFIKFIVNYRMRHKLNELLVFEGLTVI